MVDVCLETAGHVFDILDPYLWEVLFLLPALMTFGLRIAACFALARCLRLSLGFMSK